jgi:type VI secretion system protein ImpJ
MQLEPVVWTKGTFLSPQHLQQQDRFLEDLLQFHVGNLCFRPWGFRTLEISQAALAAGSFEVLRASGVFPDGLLFDMPGSDNTPAAKPLADLFDGDQETIDLFLAVPRYHARGLNVASRGADVRYWTEIQFYSDENTGLSDKPVQVARKNFRLLVDGDAGEGYTRLRVARVRRTQAGMFQWDPRFVPPLIDLQANEYLKAIARRLVEILSARSSVVAGLRRQKNQTLADFTSGDIANFWMLYTINTAFPAIRHLFETRRGHPELLFAAMLSLAGALTTFSTTIHPRELPLYDHDNLGECFADLDEKLRTLLDTVIPTNFVSLPLRQTQTAIHAVSVDDDKYLVNTRMYLGVKTGGSQAEVVTRVPQLIKICSADQIDHLVRRALPGVPLTFMSSPPSVIPVKVDYQYFSLSQGGAAWESVLRGRSVAAYVPADFPDAELELVILLPGLAPKNEKD